MFDIDLLNYFTESQNRYNFMITRPDAESFSSPITEKRAYLMYTVYNMAAADWSTPRARTSATTL